MSFCLLRLKTNSNENYTKNAGIQKYENNVFATSRHIELNSIGTAPYKYMENNVTLQERCQAGSIPTYPHCIVTREKQDVSKTDW